ANTVGLIDYDVTAKKVGDPGNTTDTVYQIIVEQFPVGHTTYRTPSLLKTSNPHLRCGLRIPVGVWIPWPDPCTQRITAIWDEVFAIKVISISISNPIP